MVRILYFAWLRDAVGPGEEEVELPATIVTVRDLADFLSQRSEGHSRAFADLSRIRVAIDLVMAGFDDSVERAAEVAFFPPVTGG